MSEPVPPLDAHAFRASQEEDQCGPGGERADVSRERQAAGIGQGLIRLAVGLEHVNDIQADLQRGLGQLV